MICSPSFTQQDAHTTHCQPQSTSDVLSCLPLCHLHPLILKVSLCTWLYQSIWDINIPQGNGLIHSVSFNANVKQAYWACYPLFAEKVRRALCAWVPLLAHLNAKTWIGVREQVERAQPSKSDAFLTWAVVSLEPVKMLLARKTNKGSALVGKRQKKYWGIKREQQFLLWTEWTQHTHSTALLWWLQSELIFISMWFGITVEWL